MRYATAAIGRIEIIKRFVTTNSEKEAACLNCGLVKSQWMENDGDGYVRDGQVFCCEGCGEETGCTCG